MPDRRYDLPFRERHGARDHVCGVHCNPCAEIPTPPLAYNGPDGARALAHRQAEAERDWLANDYPCSFSQHVDARSGAVPCVCDGFVVPTLPWTYDEQPHVEGTRGDRTGRNLGAALAVLVALAAAVVAGVVWLARAAATAS